MEINQDRIDDLIQAPTESLNVEIKRWIDPTAPEGQAKIIKGCLALRNRNGGFLVIGFDDRTLLPDAGNEPDNPREQFHVDAIQGLVSKHAQELFEIAVAYSSRDGVDFPVIVVPTGVQVPVAAKKTLKAKDGKVLVSERDVYFRTLNANGIPSSSVAHPKDWREIIEICFENREADIGRFLRRNLSDGDRRAFAETLLQFGLAGNVTTASRPQHLCEAARKFLELGGDFFKSALEKRKPDAKMRAMAEGLTWEVALVVDPQLAGRTVDREFLNEVLGSNPQYTGWPVWIDLRGAGNKEDRPYRTDSAWEALVGVVNGWAEHLEFWHIEPSRLYLRRALQDDLSDKVAPGTALDPILVILRVAEAIAVGLATVRTLAGGQLSSERRLGFAFKWSNLENRKLQTWANPMVGMIGVPTTNVENVETFVEVPSDTPIKAVGPFVVEATRELFASFDGERIASHVIEHWVQKLLNRQL